MPPKKQIPKKKQAWLNIVNRAVQLNIRPVISNTRHIRYIRKIWDASIGSAMGPSRKPDGSGIEGAGRPSEQPRPSPR